MLIVGFALTLYGNAVKGCFFNVLAPFFKSLGALQQHFVVRIYLPRQPISPSRQKTLSALLHCTCFGERRSLALFCFYAKIQNLTDPISIQY